MKILDVGQCGFDGPRMERLLRDSLQATVTSARSAEEAKRLLAAEEFDIVLVNRVFANDGGDGIALVGELAKSSDTPVMLVSDRPDAQDAAVKLGAVRGFGKSHLYEPAILEMITAAAAKLT